MGGIPFLNGGLFECLDKVYRAGEKLPEARIDGFSDHPKNPLRVPDFLFFGEERAVDLSAAYGEKRHRQATVRGLIHTFNRYKFTITENTPLDQEVALDPELSGKVFENLLAAYNPETATTARKQTGSFYTPREIVDYMVDEALIAYLETALANGGPRSVVAAPPKTDATERVPPNEERLRHLLAYNDEPHQFTPAEVETLIAAIDNLKALDPACGSGAFPMGLLHKLVFILGKLDPHNERWKQKQIAKASEIPDATVREKVLADIEQAFAAGELDYGRKLYLIENCIYGVDIQPIAVQIAKMRFFISLIVEQKVQGDTDIPVCEPQGDTDIPVCDSVRDSFRDSASISQSPQARMPVPPWNLGIRPLPNLETKFVAANTLIGIEKPAQQMLRNPQIDAKEAELRQVRERHFTARTPATKAKYRELDAKLRAEIGELLRQDGFPRETTEKLANWNPYDQNASADFFDPEWMFGIRDGFDIVIGNPPYLFGEHLKNQKQLYADRFELARGQFDAYWLFYERSLNGLLRPTGIHCFINSDAMLARDETVRFRKWLLREAGVLMMSHVGQVFGGVGVSAVVVLVMRGGGPLSSYTVVAYDETRRGFDQKTRVDMSGIVQDQKIRLHCAAQRDASWEFLSRQRCTFGDCFEISRGEELGKKHLLRRGTGSLPQGCVPILAGEGVTRFCQPRPTHFVSKSEVVKPISNYKSPKIVIVKTGEQFIAAVDNDDLITLQSVYNLHPKKEISCQLGCALLNSKVLNALLKHRITGQKKLFPQITQSNVLEMPVPNVRADEESPIVKLVDKILAAKRADAAADTSALEREIDERVYRLYGLTPDEIKIVEDSAR